MQEDFDNIMREYPESSKAMDLIAEHRLRSLHASAAWRSKQDALHDAKMASLGAKIEHVLEVRHRTQSREQLRQSLQDTPAVKELPASVFVMLILLCHMLGNLLRQTPATL